MQKTVQFYVKPLSMHKFDKSAVFKSLTLIVEQQEGHTDHISDKKVRQNQLTQVNQEKPLRWKQSVTNEQCSWNCHNKCYNLCNSTP